MFHLLKKSTLAVLVLSTFLLSTLSLVAGVSKVKATTTTTPEETTVYRFFNLETGSHLFTSSVYERDTIINTLSEQWKYEGPVYTVLAEPAEGAVAVYRFFNTQTGVHFYTISEVEKQQVEEELPEFEYEGVKYYVYASQLPSTSPVYRFFNEQNKAHLYTDNVAEYENITENLPYFDQEGVKFYVKPYAGEMGTIILKATKVEGGVQLTWVTNNWTDKSGFKVVKSEDPNPVYPGNDYVYLSDVDERGYTWEIGSGAYHFRVCRYLGGSCDIYSNDVWVNFDDTTTPTEGQIVLSGQAVEGGVKLTWTVSGLNPNLGFKLVKDTNANPVYPGDDYIYLSDSDVREYVWEITNGETYHFRVCKYLGGSCGTYSNDITVTAPSGESIPEGAAITLTGSVVADGISLSWVTANLGTFNGYKVVASEDAAPTYPEDGYVTYISNVNTKSYKWTIKDGNEYHIRVCRYAGGTCSVYSNELVLTAPTE